MIFVTVGTHEQPFDRLIQYIDELKGGQTLREEVILQIGYSVYEPRHCDWERFFPYHRIEGFIREARIIVTHGGPSSFIPALQIGKVPVVVPRKKEFGEHVNDHQVKFCKAVAERERNIIVVEEIRDLGRVLLQYDEIASKLSATAGSHNEQFNHAFLSVVDALFPPESQTPGKRAGVSGESLRNGR